MDDEADAALMAEISNRLVAAATAALGPWLAAAVVAAAGPKADPNLAEAAHRAGARCAAELGDRLRDLVALDIDEQSTTPLAILRTAGAYGAVVLAGAGVAAPVRDPFEERATPGDRYGLGPATWADLGPDVGELGIAWGAAKAHLHLRRHRP